MPPMTLKETDISIYRMLLYTLTESKTAGIEVTNNYNKHTTLIRNTDLSSVKSIDLDTFPKLKMAELKLQST